MRAEKRDVASTGKPFYLSGNSMAGGGEWWSEARWLSPLNSWLTSNRNPQRPPKATFHPCVGLVCGGEVVVSSQRHRWIVTLRAAAYVRTD